MRVLPYRRFWRALISAAVLVLLAGIAAANPLNAGESAVSMPVAAAARAVLERHCAACHDAGRPPFANILDLAATAEDPTLVQPGNPDGSRLYTSMLTGVMPPRQLPAPNPRPSLPTPEEVQAVRDWIAQLQPPASANCENAAVEDVAAEALNRIVQDIDNATAQMKRRSRYLSLANLAVDCRHAPKLAVYRAGLAEVLTMIGLTGKVVKPVAIDKGETLLRVDLDDLGWDGVIWDRLIASNPYAVSTSDRSLAKLFGVSGSSIPLVRGDWLAFASAQPEFKEFLNRPPANAAPPNTNKADAIKNGDEALKLASAYKDDVSLAEAVVELGIGETELNRRVAGVGGEIPLLIERLRRNRAPRREFERLFPLLLSWTSDDKPLREGQRIGIAQQPADAPELTLFADRTSYAKGDEFRVRVRTKTPCRLTLIDVDPSGRGTVLLPNEFMQNTVLKAGEEVVVPAPANGFRLRLNMAGKETLIAICGLRGKYRASIAYDFERQNFPDLGDWRDYVRRVQGGEMPIQKPRPPQPLLRWKDRPKPLPPEPIDTTPIPPNWPDELRAAITLDVR